MPDFIPDQDDDFATFSKNLESAVNDVGNPLALTAGQISAFNAAIADWNTAWPIWTKVRDEVNSKLEAKDDGRSTAEQGCRDINKTVQANPAVSDSAKAGAGLPVHKETRTPVGAIETSPMIVRLDNEHLLQRIWFADSTTPGSKAKPHGAAFVEIRMQIVAAGAPAPTDPNAMPFLANDTKTPYRADFEAEDVGKTAYYAMRWTNTRGEPGPWSEIASYLIN